MGEVLPFRPEDADWKKPDAKDNSKQDVQQVEVVPEERNKNNFQTKADVLEFPQQPGIIKPEQMFSPERQEKIENDLKIHFTDFSTGLAHTIFPRLFRGFKQRREINRFVLSKQSEVISRVVQRLANEDLKFHVKKNSVKVLIDRGERYLLQEIIAQLLQNPHTRDATQASGVVEKYLGAPERSFEDLSDDEKKTFQQLAPQVYEERKRMAKEKIVEDISSGKKKDKQENEPTSPEDGGGGNVMDNAA